MHRNENNQVLLQYGAAITASITSAGYGSIMSWTSPALTYLKSDESDIPFTKDQLSWIAPLLPIGLIIGNFLNPLFVNRIGRKWTLMMFAVPQIISWLIIYCTKSHHAIYIARIMGGIGYGGGVCAVTVYLSEIGTPQNRGIFLTMIKFSLSLGIFFTLLLGATLSYNWMNLGHLVMPLLFFAIFFFLPDSTYFSERNTTEDHLGNVVCNCAEDENYFLNDVPGWKKNSRDNCLPNEKLGSKDDQFDEKNCCPEEETLLNGNVVPQNNCSRNNNFPLKGITSREEDYYPKGNFPSKKNHLPKGNSPPNEDHHPKGKYPPEEDHLPKGNSPPKEDHHPKGNFLPKEDHHPKGKHPPKEDHLLKENSPPKEDYHLKDNLLPKETLPKISQLRKKSLLSKLKESGLWKMFSTPNNLRALTIIVCIVAQDALSGHMTLTYFSEQMLSYKGSLLTPKQGALFLAVMKLLSCVVATQVIERLNRRTLYFSTGMLASLSQGMIGIFFLLEEKKMDVSSFAFVPFVGLIIYEFSVSMGTSNLFYVLQGELFESDVKGLAVTFAKNMYMVFGFVSIIMYQVLTDSFSKYVLFFIFFVCGVVLCAVTVVLMPETKGKSIEEIQMLLRKKILF